MKVQKRNNPRIQHLWNAFRAQMLLGLMFLGVVTSPMHAQMVTETAVAANRFGIQFLKQLIQANENQDVVCSAFSMHTALSMLEAGASGESEQLLRTQLSLPSDAVLGEELRKLFISLNQALGKNELKISNGIWPEQSLAVGDEFLKDIQDRFFGSAFPMDYKHNPEGARGLINSEIEENTQGLIKELLPAESITKDTRMVLTNAVYFKGEWQISFDESQTNPMPFVDHVGHEAEVQMMHMPGEENYLNYTEIDGAQVLELPYQGGQLSMIVVLPRQGEFFDFMESFDIVKWQQCLFDLRSQQVEVFLPKFRIDFGGSMKPVLTKMGLAPIFEQIELKRMAPSFTNPLKVSDVFHKAFIDVAEQGTEAAAATAVVIEEDTATMEEFEETIVEFKADHPFLYFIRHTETGLVLFSGCKKLAK